jgi:hypothetical protein
MSELFRYPELWINKFPVAQMGTGMFLFNDFVEAVCQLGMAGGDVFAFRGIILKIEDLPG